MGDVLALLEAAYATCDDERAYLARLVTAARPLFPDASAVTALAYTIDPASTVRLGPLVADGVPAEPLLDLAKAGVAAMACMPEGPAIAAAAYPRAPAASTFRQLAPNDALGDAAMAPFASLFEQVSAGSAPRDALGIVAGEPSGRGLVINAYVRGRFRLPPSRAILFARVAAHLAAGYRLQRGARDAPPDAVLTANGRVAHAEPMAKPADRRAALAEAATAIDRARGRLRRADPDKAVALWTALVRGRWSLVEQVDHDGRRYLFARRNAPEVVRWDALTERERQVVAYAAEGQPHKMIAYELGVTTSTVATLLKSAATKIGVASRLALVRAYRARECQPHKKNDTPTDTSG